MAQSLVSYALDTNIATITMNDGGKNLVTPDLLQELNAALDQSEKDKAVVILTGHEDIFSAGFDLKILRKGGVKEAFAMLLGGFATAVRILEHPTPVIMAVNGHAIAMGSFLVLSGDYRIGTKGDYKIAANEVAIGLPVPFSMVELCRQRLTPAYFNRVTTLAEYQDPETSVEGGFFDTIVERDDLMATARQKAEEFAKLDMESHHNTKLRVRGDVLKSAKKGLIKDRLDIVGMGLKRLKPSKKK